MGGGGISGHFQHVALHTKIQCAPDTQWSVKPTAPFLLVAPSSFLGACHQMSAAYVTRGMNTDWCKHLAMSGFRPWFNLDTQSMRHAHLAALSNTPVLCSLQRSSSSKIAPRIRWDLVARTSFPPMLMIPLFWLGLRVNMIGAVFSRANSEV
jgi:hypothetical protein